MPEIGMSTEVRPMPLCPREYLVLDTLLTTHKGISISACSDSISGKAEERFCIKLVSAERWDEFQMASCT